MKTLPTNRTRWRCGSHGGHRLRLSRTGGLLLAVLLSVSAAGEDPSIQAIRQATDPSAVVAAYANGVARDLHNPPLYNAYVSRMVDLGLPELAYHQAQALTTLESNNGLAWGVVAYVDARRGQMPEAIAAIDLAGQFAPDNQFVAHTAGELVAWYDFKADKTTLAADAVTGLAKLRVLLGTQSAYTEAYRAAQSAYQNRAQADTQAPAATTAQSAYPPQVTVESDQIAPLGYGYAAPATAPAYAPDDYDQGPGWADWGPGWVAPAPSWWWQPCGYWGGLDFFPFGSVVLFNDFGGFHHFHGHGFAHDGRFSHAMHGGRDGWAAAGHEGFWHGQNGRQSFFGTPARPDANVAAGWNHQGSVAASLGTPTSGHWWNSAGIGSTHALNAQGLPGSAGAARVGTQSFVPNTLPGAYGGFHSPAYGAYGIPRWSGRGSLAYGGALNTGGWRGHQPMGSVPGFYGHSLSGGFQRGGAPRSFAAPSGGVVGGGFRSGGFHGGGGGFRGGGGGFHGGGGGGFHGGGHR